MKTKPRGSSRSDIHIINADIRAPARVQITVTVQVSAAQPDEAIHSLESEILGRYQRVFEPSLKSLTAHLPEPEV